MENIVFIIVLLIIGNGLRYLPAFPKNSAQVMTSFVIHVSLPALILVQIPKLPISPDILVPCLIPWTMVPISALLVIACARFFKWSNSITGALMLLVPLGNTSFFGIPMVEAFFGNQYVCYALLYDQLGTFLILGTLGPIVIAVYSNEGKPEFKTIIKKIITFPPLISLILAFVFYSTPYPSQISFMLECLAATLIPLVIIAVGLKMAFQIEKKHYKPMIFGLGTKLCIAPLIALGIVYLFGLKSTAAHVSVFEAGMPPQISAWALAMSAGLAPKLGAMMVGIGIILSFLTLTVLFQLL